MTALRTTLSLLLCALAVSCPQRAQAWDDNDCGCQLDCCCEPTQVLLGSYIWFPTYDGKMMIKGNQMTLDVSLVELIDESDSVAVFVAREEVRKGRWGAYLDFQYGKLGFDGQQTPLPNLSFDIAFRFILAELAIFYELCQIDFCSYCTTWDVYVGGRYSRYDMSLVFSTTGNKLAGSLDWFDPIVGFRAIIDLGCCWDLFVAADVGGFGLGSDFSWKAAGGLRYNFSWCGNALTMVFLYRVLDQDYSTGSSTGGSAYDMLVHGPQLGLGWTF